MTRKLSWPDPVAYLTGQGATSPRPQDITKTGDGGKFSPDGKPLIFPGNTVICHVDPKSLAYEALVDLQAMLQSGAHANAFTFLPPTSFHMTVFQGISGSQVRPDEWPDGIAFDTSRDDVSQILLQRLQSISVADGYTIKPCGLFAGHSLRVEGATEQEESALRSARDQLRDATGIRTREHDGYIFHITLAYPLRWLEIDEARQVITYAENAFSAFKDRIESIELGRLEFCEFETMHHFQTKAWMGTKGVVPL